MKHVSTLVVIALLQLCRAEISNSLPKWYEANLINESSYQPKPITEIFTTPETLSSKPIVVASSPTTSEPEKGLSTTSSTSLRQTSVAESFTTEDTTRRVLPIDRDTSLLPRAQDEREQRVIYQPQPRPIQVISAQSLPERPIPQLQSFPQFQASPQQQQSTGQPNYFLIYQQAPLSIQQYPESASQSRPSTTPESTQQSTREPITSRTTQETTTPPRSTQSTTTRYSTTERPLPDIISAIQMSSSTIRPIKREEQIFVTSSPILFGGPWQNPSTLLGPAYYSPSIFSSSTVGPSLTSTGNPNATLASVIPTMNASSAVPSTQRLNKTPALTIRVSAPRGSVTNIKINPSTTTRRPSSRRPQSRKGHNYSVCVNSCKGKKEPICGAPLNMVPINPDKLKGFPSICHLACHNSFRKNQPYEKIMDGRCSKLRTRIRTVDKSKIRRDELNKSQYTVLSNNQETVVQIIPNERSA
ncbi:PREDICTED: mucin-5AC-like [Papilio polytes]|uniref:mucin-5AC-like n=1 Tax=Papilio polytes TaxID=76194 RepID=UPI000675FFD6|nr:PREDICTED: mucin-5AC-like [Papilio polytes]